MYIQAPPVVQAEISSLARRCTQESLLCNHPHAMAKSPSETMYCEPLSNTASIIVMVFLLSRTLNVLRVVSYIVLRASVNAQVVPLSLFSTARSQPIGMLGLITVRCKPE